MLAFLRAGKPPRQQQPLMGSGMEDVPMLANATQFWSLYWNDQYVQKRWSRPKNLFLPPSIEEGFLKVEPQVFK